METLFAIVYRPGPSWVTGQPLRTQPLGSHRDYISRLFEAGQVVLAGPFLDDDSGGIAIVRAADALAAREVLMHDPAVVARIFTAELRPLLPLFASAARSTSRDDASVKVVRQIFQAVESRGDASDRSERWALYQQAYDPEVTIHEADSLPYGGEYRGPIGVARHAAGFNAAWSSVQTAEERAVEPRFFATDDGVAVLWRHRAHNPWTQERLDMPVVSVYRLSAGRVVDSRMCHFDVAAVRAFLDRIEQARANAVSGEPAAAQSPRLAHARAVLAAQPFSALLGARLLSFDADRVEIELPITRQLQQQNGFVHGGVLSYLADNTLTFAGALTLEGRVVTSEMKINYIRPAVGERLIARGQTISSGRRQAVTRCEIFIVDSGGERLCAAAQGTIATTPAAEAQPGDARQELAEPAHQGARSSTTTEPSVGRRS